MKLNEVVIEDSRNSVRFRKMKVESGFLYNFWNVEAKEWERQWEFVPDGLSSTEHVAENNPYTEARKRIAEAKTRLISNDHPSASGGVLWSSRWQYKDGRIMQQTVMPSSPTALSVWNVFKTDEQAIEEMRKELEIIDTAYKNLIMAFGPPKVSYIQN